jgi:tight adherence protein B
MLKLFILVLVVASAGLLGAEFIYPVIREIHNMQKRRAEHAADRMESMFVRVKLENFIVLYSVLPVALGCLAYFVTHNLPLVLLGAFLGFVIPGFRIKMLEGARRRQFRKQLIDGLMILSSSLKGGLSLIQALEVLVEEMPSPINQEFGMVLAENKIGISLEESFVHLNKRMPSSELNQLITAILLARETGGNLPVIFSRLVFTMRENDKIKQAIENLTLQGRLQGAIMSALPVVFAVVVYSLNPHNFDEMLNTSVGRSLLIYCVFSQIIGMILIKKFSTLDF